MAIVDRHSRSNSDKKLFGFCPFWQTSTTATPSSSASSTQNLTTSSSNPHVGVPNSSRPATKTVSYVARSLLPPRRRLRLDPSNNLYFPYEPGKQTRSAVRLKNTSKSHVAFKFQTTAPKSCYMRPPGGVLAPGDSIIATVFKFVEAPENNERQPLDQKSKDKFKIMSLKVKGGIDYVPELFDEQKDQVTVERILRVVFLNAERPSPALEKLKRQLAEAEAALEARKRPPPDTGPRVVGEGLVIDEWKERREKYLARQQVEAVDSVFVIYIVHVYGHHELPLCYEVKCVSSVQNFTGIQLVANGKSLAACRAKLRSSSVPRNSNLWKDAVLIFLKLKMGLKNKACVLVTVGAALGLRDHGIKSNSFAVKPELTTIVSSILQAKLDQVDRSKKILEKGNEMHQAAEESLRMVVYLSCWGPN
ncbi:Vesicle-associated protein 4-1 [Citrus sinensis]|uniref:Vesicle-associated protein 4-1 n=1 Tax=Citrus sinensis TaxID=2711 RepID=A0ACB8NXN3_CITSI|nr:Vesicle-associated protein 4-1 [Citrus sinensis]